VVISWHTHGNPLPVTQHLSLQCSSYWNLMNDSYCSSTDKSSCTVSNQCGDSSQNFRTVASINFSTVHAHTGFFLAVLFSLIRILSISGQNLHKHHDRLWCLGVTFPTSSHRCNLFHFEYYHRVITQYICRYLCA